MPLLPKGDLTRCHTTTQIFNDPVHGHFRLDPVSRKIYDTPQFQRLGDLKQLGCTYFVFRGASHARCNPMSLPKLRTSPASE